MGRLSIFFSFAIALILTANPAAAQRPMWIHGTGTATAHDRQLAHNLAFNDARRRAQAWCRGVYTGAAVVRSSYARVPANGQWKATVMVREQCTGHPVRPSDPNNGGGFGAG